MDHKTIRIFISSPGDVAEEREGARRVIAGLQRFYLNATLKAVLWEELALPATASFQETIDFLLEREPIDIAVFILWSRLGSPLGAAITKPDGTPYRSGTEREFDLMLAAFEQSGRKRPVIIAYVRDDDAGFKRKLAESPQSKLPELIDQQQLAESFVVEQFHDSEGRNLRAYQSYREPIAFVQRLRIHLRRAIDDLLEIDSASWAEEPYRGLQTFDVEHASIFYGREVETCDLLQRLRDQQDSGCAFVVIVGASGSGKSSLARAGVAANLVEHADDNGAPWQVSAFIPTLADQSLCHALARSLVEGLSDPVDSNSTVDRIADGLLKNAKLTVKQTIAPAFASAGKPVRQILILDQMEELWTDRHTSEEDRASFLAAVEALARSGYVAVLATLRSDFYDHAQASATFLRLKGKLGQFDLLPPDAGSMHRLITEPARLSGLGFEQNQHTGRSLDEVILRDATHDANALPLLEYTLSELYRQRDENRRLMTYAAYVELGGVEGAIGKRADETFANLPTDAQDALDEILPLLVSVDVTGEKSAVRRRAPVADLASTPGRKTLAERLIDQRFLTTDREGDTPVVSLAHEALLRSWDRIVVWINANREQLRLRARVEQSQQRFEQQGSDESLLLAEGLPLDEGRQLITDSPYLLTDSTKDYIEASIAFRDQKTAQSKRRRAVVLSMMAVLLMAIIVGGTWMRRSRQRELTSSLVDNLSQARGQAIPYIIKDLKELPATMAQNELIDRFVTAESTEKLPIAFGLASFGDVRSSTLASELANANAEELDNFLLAFGTTRREAIKALYDAAKICDETPVGGNSFGHWRYKARIAIICLQLGDTAIAVDMCQLRTDPIQRTVFVEECSPWCDLLELSRVTGLIKDSALRSAIAMVVGGLQRDRMDREPAETRREWQDLLSKWHLEQPDGATHSVSGWALRQWGLPVPNPSQNLNSERQWRVDSIGLTMLRIPKGTVTVRSNGNRGTSVASRTTIDRHGIPRTVPIDASARGLRHSDSIETYDDRETIKVTEDFLLSDREISTGLFRQFIDDEEYPGKKLTYWERNRRPLGRDPEHPIQGVNWFDAVIFCNWLSWKEGRDACYQHKAGEDPRKNYPKQLTVIREQIENLDSDTPQFPQQMMEVRRLSMEESVLLFQLGQYDQAMVRFETLIRDEKYRRDATRYLAILKARLGDSDAARDLLKQFVDGLSDNMSERAQASLEWSLTMIVESWLGNGKEAMRHLVGQITHQSDWLFFYDAACACSLSSLAAEYHNEATLKALMKSMAVQMLMRCIELGIDRERMQSDADLDPLRDEQAFLELISSRGSKVETWHLDPAANGYRLPTQTEWEYACRAGTTTTFSCGEEDVWLRRYGVYQANRSERCGSKLPNCWGLFDMHGNAEEWCQDEWDFAAREQVRSARGGSWRIGSLGCTSSAIQNLVPQVNYESTGFRVASVPSSQASPSDQGEAESGSEQSGTRGLAAEALSNDR